MRSLSAKSFLWASAGICFLLTTGSVDAADRQPNNPARAQPAQRNAQARPAQRNANQRPAANNRNQQAQQRAAQQQQQNRGAGAQAAAPTVTGEVVALEEGKSITVATKGRGGNAQTVQFAVAPGRSQIQMLGDTKAIAVGTMVAVWADPNAPTFAVRIVAGNANPQGRGENANPGRPANPNAAAPKRRPAN